MTDKSSGIKAIERILAMQYYQCRQTWARAVRKEIAVLCSLILKVGDKDG